MSILSESKSMPPLDGLPYKQDTKSKYEFETEEEFRNCIKTEMSLREYAPLMPGEIAYIDHIISLHFIYTETTVEAVSDHLECIMDYRDYVLEKLEKVEF